MAATIFVPFIALLFVGQSFQAPAEGLNIEAQIKEIQSAFEKAVGDVKTNLNIPENPDGQAIVKAIRDQQEKATKGFEDIKKNIEDSIKKNPELSASLDKLKGTLDEVQGKLKKENPEVAANAQKVADELKAAYDTVGKELQKIDAEVNKKGGIREDLDNFIKNLVNRGTAAAKEFQSKIDAVVKKDQKS